MCFYNYITHENMLTTNKTLAFKYNYLEKPFEKAFEFLERTDLEDMEPGSYSIDGEQVVAYIQHYTTEILSELKFETHDKYFDIQYMISGQEAFGYAKRDGLIVSGPYNEANDITFYQEPDVSGLIILGPGDFAIVPPEDAHKPRGIAGSTCEVKKVVVKIKI